MPTLPKTQAARRYLPTCRRNFIKTLQRLPVLIAEIGEDRAQYDIQLVVYVVSDLLLDDVAS